MLYFESEMIEFQIKACKSWPKKAHKYKKQRKNWWQNGKNSNWVGERIKKGGKKGFREIKIAFI